jgi:hypothetical protein
MAEGFIPLAKQMDFLWSELQGKEKAGFGKFLTAGVNTPEDYATLWDKTYERSGGAGDAKARDYAGSVYAAMAGGNSNQELISPNAKFTYGYLTDKGMTPQQAAGVTGRLMAESYEEMNPDARNTMAGGQGTYGVAQWRGSRMNDLANFAGVDVGGITSLPATAPGGGLLTPSGGANIMPMDPTKKPYMMGGDKTYSFDPQAAQQAAQQAQPKQGGLGGLLSTLKDKAAAVNPQTGMTGFQQFASALDPLIMKQFRGGEGIREAGAQRVAADSRNKTIEALKKYAANDPRAKILFDAVQAGALNSTEAIKEYLSITAAGNKNPIRATQKYLNGTSYVITDRGRRVYDPSGKEVFGDAAAKVLEQANTYENENRALGEGLSAGAKFQQEAAKDMYEKAEAIRGSLSNIDQAIAAIDDGAPRGILPNMLPDITAQSGILTSALRKMGLDVVGSVTFGALSKAELDIAMATAYPQNASGPELRKFLQERKAALSKLLNYTGEAADFMSNPNNTRAQWRDIIKEREAQREASGANPFMGLALGQLQSAFESTMATGTQAQKAQLLAALKAAQGG